MDEAEEVEKSIKFKMFSINIFDFSSPFSKDTASRYKSACNPCLSSYKIISVFPRLNFQLENFPFSISKRLLIALGVSIKYLTKYLLIVFT